MSNCFDDYYRTCMKHGGCFDLTTPGLRKTAEMFKNEFPESSSILINDSYVDDIIFSVDSTQWARLIGQAAL